MPAKRIHLIQLLAEMLIPLLGYFFWHWNFYFIALFYFLDLVANSIFLVYKLRRLKDSGKEQKRIVFHFTAYVLAFAGIAFLGILLSSRVLADFDLKAQSLAFILLKDMGLPQGIFLIPLVIYAAYMQYRMEFLAPKKYERLRTVSLLRKHGTGMLVTLLFLGAGYGISLLWKIPEMVAVLGLIGLTGLYSLLIKRGDEKWFT